MRPVTFPQLANNVVALRPWRQSDVSMLVDSFADPLIQRSTPVRTDNFNAGKAEEWLENHERRRLSGESINLAITVAGEDAARGSLMLAQLDWPHRSGMLGYWVNATARGRGLVSNAVGLVAGWAFDTLRLARLELGTSPDNVASQRVAERCGFVREGILRSHLEFPDGRRDTVLYSRLPSDPATGS